MFYRCSICGKCFGVYDAYLEHQRNCHNTFCQHGVHVAVCIPCNEPIRTTWLKMTPNARDILGHMLNHIAVDLHLRYVGNPHMRKLAFDLMDADEHIRPWEYDMYPTGEGI